MVDGNDIIPWLSHSSLIRNGPGRRGVLGWEQPPYQFYHPSMFHSYITSQCATGIIDQPQPPHKEFGARHRPTITSTIECVIFYRLLLPVVLAHPGMSTVAPTSSSGPPLIVFANALQATDQQRNRQQTQRQRMNFNASSLPCARFLALCMVI